MSGENYVNHVPIMTGGRGREELLEFYGRHFIPKMPADTEIAPVCRTVGQGRVIDEIIFKFTHDREMDWMLPGVPPTGKRVEVPLVVRPPRQMTRRKRLSSRQPERHSRLRRPANPCR